MPIAASLPSTCTQTIVIASLCVGFTLPGMIDEPGLVLGQDQLAEPGTRPGRQPADVVGDLHQRHRERLERAAREHERVVRGERGELVRAPTRTAGR